MIKTFLYIETHANVKNTYKCLKHRYKLKTHANVKNTGIPSN